MEKYENDYNKNLKNGFKIMYKEFQFPQFSLQTYRHGKDLSVNTGIKLQNITGVKLQVSGKKILEVNDSYLHSIFHTV